MQKNEESKEKVEEKTNLPQKQEKKQMMFTIRFFFPKNYPIVSKSIPTNLYLTPKKIIKEIAKILNHPIAANSIGIRIPQVTLNHFSENLKIIQNSSFHDENFSEIMNRNSPPILSSETLKNIKLTDEALNCFKTFQQMKDFPFFPPTEFPLIHFLELIKISVIISKIITFTFKN